MYGLLLRFFKRLGVLVVGLTAVYVAFWRVYPYIHHHRIDERVRIPAAIALFATYIVMGYVLLPAFIRLVHLVHRPKHLPLYCVTPDGFASDPMNIGVVATREQFIRAMRAAGWDLADKKTLRALAKQIVTTLLRQPYPTAPFSTLYLFGRRQDIGFEQLIDGHNSYRHHVRFWACNLEVPERFQEDNDFWQQLHRPTKGQPDRQLWVGAASKDIGLAPIRHNAQITHLVAPDTNAERELIVHDLRATGLVDSTRTVTVGRPYALRNRALRSFLKADGKLTICELKTHDSHFPLD